MKSRTLLDSFKYALQGLKTAFTGERNFRIHCAAIILVSLFGILLRLSAMKWALLFLTMGFVLVCEVVNTVAETLVDMITSEYSTQAKKVKDLAAGAVLVSAITAVLVGVFVFAEPVLNLIKAIFKL